MSPQNALTMPATMLTKHRETIPNEHDLHSEILTSHSIPGRESLKQTVSIILNIYHCV